MVNRRYFNTILAVSFLLPAGCEDRTPTRSTAIGAEPTGRPHAGAPASAARSATSASSAPVPPPPAPPSDEPLSPGESRVTLKPGPGSLSIRYEGWLPCDGDFKLDTRRVGSRITVTARDANDADERVSCVGRTELSTVANDLPPGSYTVVFDAGSGHATIEKTATVGP